MEKIEYVAERKEKFNIPNCFCDCEPELVDDFDDVKYKFVYVQCPYCGAHAKNSRTYNIFNPYQEAVEKAIEDWIKMIERIEE